jgi:PIN domain nuclease of toxin-antitoxin system
LLNQESGGAQVATLIAAGAAISAVNLAEVVGKLADAGMPAEVIHATLDSLGLVVVPFDTGHAYDTGLLRPPTRAVGLSLGDRACLALARHLGLPAITSDRAWVGLLGDVTVQAIR